MKTVTVSEIIRTAQMGDTRYVLASEAEIAVSCANADWIERCRSFRQQDAEEAQKRETFLEDVRTDLHEKLMQSRERERVLVEVLGEMVQAFVDYEMEVDIEPHHQHIKMMRKARAALAQKGDG